MQPAEMENAPQTHFYIDSHVHLWPGSAADAKTHRWMASVPHLASQHSVNDYKEATRRVHGSDSGTNEERTLLGYVYVETDRVLTQECPWNESELRWLNKLCGSSEETTNGHGPGDESLLLGIVAWAPMDRSPQDFERYLDCIEHQFPMVWAKLSGFRYLVQGIKDNERFNRLVLGETFFNNLQLCVAKGRDFTFDVGVDQHSGGTFQLESFTEVIEKSQKFRGARTVRFVLNHFCKPNLTNPAMFGEWQSCMRRLSRSQNVFMKLSGLFSELSIAGDLDSCSTPSAYATRLAPWFNEVMTLFGPSRCMWGSDWPVCKFKSPEDTALATWFTVVSELMREFGLSASQCDQIWWRTADEVYNLGVERRRKD